MEYEYKNEPINIPQRFNFCAVSTVQSALAQVGYFPPDQEELAYKIGINVSEEDNTKYSLPFPRLPKKDPRIGLPARFFNKSKPLRDFLKEYGLDPHFYRIDKIKDLESLIIKEFLEQNPMALNINLHEFDKRRPKYAGHFVSAKKYDDTTKILECNDSSPKNPSTMIHTLGEYEEAMLPKYDGVTRGVVVFRRLSNTPQRRKDTMRIIKLPEEIKKDGRARI